MCGCVYISCDAVRAYHAAMVCVDRIPIALLNTSAIPVRVSDVNRPTLKIAEVVTYDVMVEENFTLMELAAMGCNMLQIFYCWAERPSASNLSFHTMDRKCLNIVKCVLQNKVIRRHVNKVKWFTAGLSIKDMMDLQPSIECLKVFNVTVGDLQANNAHHHGENWQKMFQWTKREWIELGFDQKEYLAEIQRKRSALGGISHDKLAVYASWGPAAIV